MKIPPLVSLLALALCASCVTTPPAGNPPANPPARPPANASATPAAPTLSTAQQLGGESQAALNAKDYSLAKAAAAEALQLDPQYEEAWVVYGMASLRMGETDRARQSYERALAAHQARESQSPPDAGQAYQKIILLSLLGRTADALALLNRARSDFPNDEQLTTMAAHFPEFQQKWQEWMAK